MHSAIRVGDYKLVKDWMTWDSCLYNLAKDISESKDIADSMPQKARELDDRLMGYLAKVNAETAEGLLQARIKRLKQQQAKVQADLRQVVRSQEPDARDKWAALLQQNISVGRSIGDGEKRLETMLRNKAARR